MITNLKVDAASEGKDHSYVKVGHILRQDDEHTENDAEAGEEIEAEGHPWLEAALFWVSEDDIVGDLLRDLMIHRCGGDSPSH